ncbi:hypothetical protein D3C81_2247420 [compost metagenome]
MGTGVAHAINNIAATGIRDSDRGDRRTTRREFVYHRGVEIGVGGHCQSTRDRRGGHDQLMRVKTLLLTFFP